MDVVLWMVVGLGAGWAAGKLTLSSGDRLASAVVAGLIGAVLGGFAMSQFGFAALGGRVDTLMAALAGALWLSWAVCIVTFARRSDVELNRRSRSDGRVDPGPGLLSYAAARESLVEQLLGDADAHDDERYDQIGRRFGSLEHGVPRGADQALAKLHVALMFWDDWIDARDRGWQAAGGIRMAEWPLLARRVAADLAADREVADPRVRAFFDGSAHPRLGYRTQALAARLRAL
jgi:uncharacterized membrane protein YeaQ/YmgE (transglycosylase-associated protein family)